MFVCFRLYKKKSGKERRVFLIVIVLLFLFCFLCVVKFVLEWVEN